MASVISSPFDTARYPSPKRARFSLKHHAGHPHSLSKQKPDVDAIEDQQENMFIDNVQQEQDENISPNCNNFETQYSPHIKDSVVNKDYEVTALGLPNCGNTCYLNSIIQVLRYTPNFFNTLHSLVTSQNQLAQIFSDPSEVKPDEFFHKLHMLYIAMKKQEEFLHKNREDYMSALQDHVESFIASLWDISSLFKEGEQHDAHEFLLTVMSHFDAISLRIKQVAEVFVNNSKDLVRSNPSSPKEKKKLNIRRERCRLLLESGLLRKVADFDLGFEGSMQHTLKCLECEKKSERFESFTNLEVSIAKDFISDETVDLCQCLVQRTILSDDNKYFCEECFHSTEARLTAEIISLPSVLVLHCSWLRQSSFLSQMEKDDTKLAIPLFIKASENSDIFLNATDEIYCLYAIVLHIGTSAENGHYVSFIKEMSKTSEITDFSWIKNNQQHYGDISNCCAKENAFNMETNSCSTNNWLFFDDEYVLSLTLGDTSVFPYYEFMTTSASPCVIFYYKK